MGVLLKFIGFLSIINEHKYFKLIGLHSIVIL